MELLGVVVVVLAATVIIVPLARRVGLGAIVGYLLAGLALGPAGLRLVSDVPSLTAVSELGVVLMMFVIGMELELSRLWSMRRDVFVAGSLQMAICGASLGLACFAAGLSANAAVVSGLAGAISSTAIALQIMEQRGSMGTPAGHTAFGILLFQDVAAIPLLLLVAVLAPSVAGGTHGPGWPAVLALLAVIGAGRWLMRPLLRFIATSGGRDVFTAAALLVVLGVAWLMHAVGLSMGLGAFVAGVLLADSEYRKAIEADIEPFKGLLLGLFFASVGMGIDIVVVKAQWAWILSIAGAWITLKGLGLWALARAAGIDRSERLQFAALLSQAGEFTFVLLAASQSSQLLTPAQTSMLTAAASLSMALTPLLFGLAERQAIAAQKTRPPPADAIDAKDAPVIIAGFGRVGQVVCRLLLAQGIRATVLDHDPQQIESLRRFDFKVYYGDATRLDLLEAAGAGEARVLVNAIDDPEASLALVDLVQAQFPNVTIIARARNVRHEIELRQRRVALVERETFESSLRLGRSVLEGLGFSPYEARQSADRFRRHNRDTVLTLLEHYGDEERMVSAAREARNELEASMRKDRELRQRNHHQGW